MQKNRKNAVSIIGGADGPTSIFVAGRTGKQSLKLSIRNRICQYKCSFAERKITADPHTLDEVMQYAKHHYEFRETAPTEWKYQEEKKSLKEGLILRYKPEVLGEFKEIGRPDTSKEDSVRAYIARLEARREAIVKLPEEVLPMDFHLYQLKMGDDSLELAIDYVWDVFGISYSGNKKAVKQFKKISKVLYRYYGVSEEDIRNKTERYASLLAALSS